MQEADEAKEHHGEEYEEIREQVSVGFALFLIIGLTCNCKERKKSSIIEESSVTL